MRILLFFLFMVFPVAVQADTVNEFIQVQCNEILNYIKIDSFNINGEISYEQSFKEKDRLWREQGIASERNLTKYVSFDDGRYGQVSLPKVEKKCKLRDENNELDEYIIDVRSFHFNGNPGGQCGYFGTFEINLKSSERVYIEDLQFSENCFSKNIKTIKFKPHEGYVSITGENAERSNYKNLIFFNEAFHFEDGLPLKSSNVYANIVAEFD